MRARYYKSGTSALSLNPRLDAIKKEIGSRPAMVLDVGCIDGTMGYNLLSTGHACQVVGIDIVSKFWAPAGNAPFWFMRADITKMDLGSLGKFDYILFLNVLHHILHEDPAHAKSIFLELLTHARHGMFFDMGSVTEKQTPWRASMEKRFGTDQKVQEYLFNGLEARDLLKYEQRGGFRTLFFIKEPK